MLGLLASKYGAKDNSDLSLQATLQTMTKDNILNTDHILL